MATSSSREMEDDRDAKSGGEDRPTKRSRMDIIDSATCFENAKARVEAAQKELAMAQKNMTEVREQMRSNGYYEPDSLLCLSDGEDDNVLSTVMEFLTVEDAGRCEMVCQTLKRRANHYWDKFDENLLSHPSRRSPSARNARERVIRYHLASNLARRIGGMGESISKHVFDCYLNTDDDLDHSRVPDCCEGCDFPEELDFGVLHRDTTDDYELFVRFSRTSDNYSFAEGFLPIRRGDNLELSLQGMDFSKWPKIVEITRLIKNHNEEEGLDNDDLLHECMRELTATVVAIDKTSSRASLVIAQSDFAGTNSRTAGIDNMGDHGFCIPKGELSCHSHGDLETIRQHSIFGDTSYNSRDSHAHLGMLFENVTWNDPTDNGRIIDVECRWTLHCTYTLTGS
jgi:hypothetical protein